MKTFQKNRGLCLHAKPDRGSCSLTRRRCPGWRKCPQYKDVKEKRRRSRQLAGESLSQGHAIQEFDLGELKK